ncbi:MAG: thymidine kinase [Geodermatophilaceae bacterium]|nr:thymidine kinase [Geodermatophilaceae bacterium]
MPPQQSAGALAAAPRTVGGRPAQLRFFHGPMDCGKSTLALQIDHNHARQGRLGLILTQDDRSAQGRITTRVGLSRTAVELSPDTDLVLVVREQWAAGHRVDYLIVDEAQFLTAAQVEQLVDLVDVAGVDVYAFGLATDFRSRLFPGSQRLLELADVISALQVEVLCWCGGRGGFNGRVVGGWLVTEGEQVLIADTDGGAETRYQVLCRMHYRGGDLGPSPAGPEQLPLS